LASSGGKTCFNAGKNRILPLHCGSPKKKLNGDATHAVHEIRGHCSDGGKRGGHRSSLFSKKITLILERLEHLKKSWFLDENYLSDSPAIPKKNCAYVQSSFESPIPRPIPSKFSEKRMSHSPIPIHSGFKGMNIAEFLDCSDCTQKLRICKKSYQISTFLLLLVL